MKTEIEPGLRHTAVCGALGAHVLQKYKLQIIKIQA